MKPTCSHAKLPPVKAPTRNMVHPRIPATPAAYFETLNCRTNQRLTPATAADATHAAGVRSSHGETVRAAVDVNPASMRTTLRHLFCQSGQKTKNGATNNNCPLSIAPVASKQPHQNHRFFKAASAA